MEISRALAIGRQQQFKLGQYFRQRYSSLLGDGNYSQNSIYVRSTNVDRVLKSAKANLAGLYCQAENQEWNENIEEHISIPEIHTQPLANDYVLASEKRCDHFDYMMFEHMNSAEIKGIFKKYKSLIRYLEENSGKKLPTLTDINVLYDTLFIEQLKGKRLPSWADEVMNEGGNFEYLMHYYFQMFTPNNEMKKIKSGFLLKEILDRFTNKTQSTLSLNRSLYLYFAHDITISNMLNSLGLFKLHQPPYSSCVFFELYQADDHAHYLQLFYKNSTATDFPALEIPACGTKCPLEKMYELYHDIIPTQSFEKECELRDGEILPASGSIENNSL
ncbi:prostatic acid phosphatase-like isoform X2 [Sitodiplosis mosellana]|uniref:prostatic acid phosphatase-like isoform X2 n=1 Tax=Sitodiplosis mosellana TaxID=263140 RepID=UPI002443E7D6|nr:prostatic acid phosphatase-like isoform X2 [Sitodiplosis mosellana]